MAARSILPLNEKCVFGFALFFFCFFIFTDFLSHFVLPPPIIITSTTSSADINASTGEDATITVTVCIATVVGIFRLLVAMTATIATATRTGIIYSTTDTVVIVAPFTPIILVALALLFWKGTPGTTLRGRCHRPRSSRSRLSTGIDLLSAAITGAERIELDKIRACNASSTDNVSAAVNSLSELRWLLA